MRTLADVTEEWIESLVGLNEHNPSDTIDELELIMSEMRLYVDDLEKEV